MPIVLSLGLATLDLLGALPAYPEKNSKSTLASWSMQGGGPAATAAAAAARLGAQTRFVGKLGDDPFGATIVAELAELGIDLRFVVRAAGQPSPFSFVAIDARDASRTVFHRPGPALGAEELDPRCLDDVGVLIVDGRQPAAQQAAATRARQAGIPVIVDAESLRPGMRELLAAAAPILIASRTLAEEVCPGGDDLAQLAALRALGATTAIITRGEQGSVGIADGPLCHQPAFAVQAVDTTGCGDVYHGAYAVALLRGEPLPRAMAFAAATAALKCHAPGGRAGLPRLDQVLALLGWPR